MKYFQDTEEAKQTAVLKIKNLGEPVQSPKRLREEDDANEAVFQKYKIKNLEVVVLDIAKSPVIGNV